MKLQHLTLFILCLVSFPSIGMDTQLQIHYPDYKSTHKLLINDCLTYLNNQLKIYEQGNIEISKVMKTCHKITKMKNVMPLFLNPDIHDENHNSWGHIAASKCTDADVSMINFLLTHNDPNCLKPNKSLSYPIDKCSLYLLPKITVSEEKKKNSLQIFNALISAVALQENELIKEHHLRTIIKLQLTHKKHKSDFIINQSVLESLIPESKLVQKPPFLTTIYRNTTDIEGDTFSHIFVTQENPNELYTLAKQGKISFTKNNVNLTPLDLAAAMFRYFTQDMKLLNDANQKSFEKRRCCLFILLNYLSINGTEKLNPDYFSQCCNKHPFHAIRNNKDNQSQELPHWSKVYNEIFSDYLNYLNNQLEKYKTIDLNMEELITIGVRMTKTPINYLKDSLTEATDAQKDNFWHIAAKKDDLNTINWLIESKIGHCLKENEQEETPLDIYLKKLSPEKNQNQNSPAYKIFPKILQYICSAADLTNDQKTKVIQGIVSLQLKHTLNNSKLYLDVSCLKKLCSNTPLSTFYQQAKDENGNTFTHALCHIPDELWYLIEHDYISLKKNNGGFSPVDIAITKFREYSQNPDIIDADPKGYQKACCCAYILLNYLKSKNDPTDNESDFDVCCDKHVITKK